jgi:hypothetical protein
MRNDDLDKPQDFRGENCATCGTGAAEVASQTGNTGPKTAATPQSLEATQVLPKFTEKYETRQHRVRELDPICEKPTRTRGTLANKKRALFLGGGFLLALVIGFSAASYFGDRQTLAENEKIHQQQELQLQKKDLEQQKVQLEREKAELAQRQKSASSQSEKMAEKSEGLLAEMQNASGIKKVWNKVTGKEQEQKTAAAENASAANAAREESATLKESLGDAEAMLDTVNRKLDEVDAMRQQAGKIKAAAESTYQENAGLIDQAGVYMAQGTDFILSLLRK